MLYYRVPVSMDQKPLYRANNKLIRNGYFLIGGELLTPSEARKINAPINLLEPVCIKKTETYSMFGARFACKEGLN